MRRKNEGFTLIELLVVIALLGVLATTVVIAINPFQQFAKARDSARLSITSQLGEVVIISSSGAGNTFSDPASTSLPNGWLTDLKNTGELSAVPASIAYLISGSSACTSNRQNNICYQRSTPMGPIIVYARLESVVNVLKCGIDLRTAAWAIFSSADGRGGIVCSPTGTTTEPTPGTQTFVDSSNSASGTSSSPTPNSTPIPTSSPTPTPISTPAPTPIVGNFYVATTGNDTNPGTLASPFKTIQKGINSASAGNTVVVEDGTYSSGEITISNSGTASNWITLQAQNTGAAHVVQSVSGGHGFLINGSYIKIIGFDISGFDWAGFWDNQGGHDINLSGNIVRNIGNLCTDTSLGIVGLYFHSVTNITLDGNVFHDIGRFFNGQNGCSMANPTYAYNHDHALYIDGSSAITIKNGIFYNNVHGWSVQIYSSNALASSNINIINNTFSVPNPNRNGQIILAGTLSNSLIENNIFNNPTVAAIDIQTYNNAVYTNVAVANNITTTSQMTDLTISGVNLSNNKLSTDPKLVNSAGNDFHLLSTSPAIDAGLTLGQVTTDFDGNTRPRGANYDIGAYEY